ncbi:MULTISPECIES: cell division protein FtsA C-terminal domain-containing protein [Streptococcus]|uniref:Cell division protein FtsA C-terminal domain-containing protein n=1 Tax=Streptococcus caledonicus TaxID=2614158 RepID=A0ABW0UDA4_9STRE
MRRKPIDMTTTYTVAPVQPVTPQSHMSTETRVVEPPVPTEEKINDKPKFGDRMRNIFGSMFD